MVAAAWLVCAMAVAGQQPPAPATPPPPAAEAVPVNVDDLPVSLNRIQRALSTRPSIQLKEEHPVFRLEIFGRKQTIDDILGEKFWIGPTPYGGMTHQDFLAMVTPNLAQPYAGFSGKYLVAQTALTLLEMWAVKAAIKKFQAASGEHEREAARKEVLDALAALERARTRTPDK
jgi:hypothetical protein